MGYYDGNTVTAFWNYAQYFAMNDNSYDTNFGPSTPGALNLISGQTNGAINNIGGTGAVVDDGLRRTYRDQRLLIRSAMCAPTSSEQFQMSGPNIGEALTAANVTWGFFEGGFDLTITNSNGTTGCNRSTTSTVTNTKKADYIPASSAVPVLRRHRKSDAHAADLRRDDRSQRRRRQSSVRHQRFLRSGECEQFAGGEFPEGSGQHGRPRRLLRSAGRADIAW